MVSSITINSFSYVGLNNLLILVSVISTTRLYMDRKPHFRRTPAELIDAIYNALTVGDYQTVEAISHKAGVDWRTTQKWLETMMHVLHKQNRKNSWLVSVTLGENKGYARKLRRGEKDE